MRDTIPSTISCGVGYTGSLLTKDPGGIYRSPQLAALCWMDHGFGSSRAGDWIGSRPCATLTQVHSAIVMGAGGETGRLGQGDALVTAHRGIWLAIRTADCVPVILADPVHRVVGIAHAGWRGAVAGVVERTVERMCVEFATSVSDLLVSFGPSIGPCCFEVGPEVARQFRKWFPERDDLNSKTLLDLETALLRQLMALGADPDKAELSDACTQCGTGEFESFRRDGDKAGRMVSAVLIRP